MSGFQKVMLLFSVMSKVNQPSSMIYCVVGAAFFIFANLFTFERIQYGVNFFDEAFYSSVPFRFLLGQKLFIDDLFLVQTFGLISYPLLKIHSLFYTGTDGLIYFMRFIYLVLYFFLGLFVISHIRNFVGLSSAVLIAGICGLFVPGGIPSISYNTLGTFFLTLGLFSIFFGTKHGSQSWIFLSGVLMGLCSLSYVTFSVISIFLGMSLLVFEKDRKLTFFYALGLLIVTTLPAYLLLKRIETFREALYFSEQIGYSANKASLFLDKIHRLLPLKVLAIFLVFIGSLFTAQRKDSKTWSLILVSLIPMLAFICAEISWGRSNVYLWYFSMFGLILFVYSPKSSNQKKLFQYVFLPSVLGGSIAMFTSALGHLNVQVGLLPAVIVSLIYLCNYLNSAPQTLALLNHLIIGLPTLLMMSYPFVLWDESPKRMLTAKIMEGPYSHLYTSPEKKHYLEEVSHSLKSHVSNQGVLLVYPNFSAGYLIAGMKPAPGILSYQHNGVALDSLLAKKYKSDMTNHSRVLKMNVWYAHPDLKAVNSFDGKSELIQLLQKTHYPVEQNHWITVLAPKPK